MEETLVCRDLMCCDYARDGLKNFHEIREYVVKKYLKDLNLSDIKKASIEKLLNQVIKAIKNDRQFFPHYQKEAMELCHFAQLDSGIKSILGVDNLQVLQSLNEWADFEDEDNTLFFGTFISVYHELMDFKNSGFDESNYDKEINSLIKKLQHLQKYSSTPIKLDKVPFLPSDIISLSVMDNKGFFKNTLQIVNSLLSITKARYKGEYKILPKRTRQ